VVGYVWRPWGIHIDIVRDRGSKGMDRCPLTIAHIRTVSHDPMAPSDGRRTSISGRLGTRRLGTVIFTISSVV
jgi:hypothetical protein